MSLPLFRMQWHSLVCLRSGAKKRYLASIIACLVGCEGVLPELSINGGRVSFKPCCSADRPLIVWCLRNYAVPFPSSKVSGHKLVYMYVCLHVCLNVYIFCLLSLSKIGDLQYQTFAQQSHALPLIHSCVYATLWSCYRGSVALGHFPLLHLDHFSIRMILSLCTAHAFTLTGSGRHEAIVLPPWLQLRRVWIDAP